MIDIEEVADEMVDSARLLVGVRPCLGGRERVLHYLMTGEDVDQGRRITPAGDFAWFVLRAVLGPTLLDAGYHTLALHWDEDLAHGVAEALVARYLRLDEEAAAPKKGGRR